MDDLELIQSCSNGDKHSLEEFISRYSRLIYNYILTVFQKSAVPVPRDLVNEVFNDIFCLLFKDGCRKLKSFKAKNGSSLATWLRVVTIHFTVDFVRARKMSISLDHEDSRGSVLGDKIADAGSVSAYDAASRAELLDGLKDCLRSLTPQERYFIELHINQGISLALLQDIFKASRGAVDMQKNRIVNKLRQCFKSKGFMLDI